MAWISGCKVNNPNKVFSFRKDFTIDKKIPRAVLQCTALGIYSASLNGVKVGKYFLTPGFTSYRRHLQEQSFDIKSLLKEDQNSLNFTLSGGWAVGKYGLKKRSRVYSDRPALCFTIKITYTDGTEEVITSDNTCLEVKSQIETASIYDGEVVDARIKPEIIGKAEKNNLSFTQKIVSTPVHVISHEERTPINVTKSKKGYIYDFGQNFAGVIKAEMNCTEGEKITFYHAEILEKGKLCRKTLRSAKAQVIYIAKEGKQTYIPTHTYMVFRHVEVIGIDPSKIKLTALALYSDVKEIGDFSCSDEFVNKLQSCIKWGAKSNFVDIPTDCPQRDERMGWTADTAVFSRTACFNFSMNSFYEKWLCSMRDDQGENGQIPDVVPKFDMSNNRSASIWADACSIVPWSCYLAYGDKKILENQFPCICSYIQDGLTHLTDYVWDKGFQYGDWCAPDCSIKGWKDRGKYVGTCYFANTVKIASHIASILGDKEKEKEYSILFDNICEGFIRRFVNEDGSIKGEFQSAYVLPLYFGMAGKYRKAFSDNLTRLVKRDNYHLSTGFAGTPYLLFALCDNGYEDLAYQVLMQKTYPSWLYEVTMGATTMWERWNAIKPNGRIYNASMTSFNHYAYGSVGDFLYRRVLGIEALTPGYQKSQIKPIVGGGLTHAEGHTITPYGRLSVHWEVKDNIFSLDLTVPDGTESQIILPSGEVKKVSSGEHHFSEERK